jgi:predicted dithiol-disulfide oxidoreductase (DUF899 family)
MCSMWADGYDAVAAHVGEHAAFVVVARADIRKLRAFARDRGWRRIPLLSSLHNQFNSDFDVEEDDPAVQHPGLSVFVREPDGTIRCSYTGQARLRGEHWRGLDLYTPVWNLLDLLPEGRGEWVPSHAG